MRLRVLRRAVLGGASTLAIAIGLLGGLGPASPGTAARAATAQTASPSLPSSLSCVYEVTAEWAGGFSMEVILTNHGTTTVDWSLTWTWQQPGQQLTSVWGAEFTQSGQHVTVTGPPIPPGGSLSFGFTGTGPPPVLPPPCTPAN